MTKTVITGENVAGVLSDAMIDYEVVINKMIVPYAPAQVKTENGRRVISYGLSSYGYDFRLAPDVKIFTGANWTVINPKKFDASTLTQAALYDDPDGGRYFILPPNGFALGVTVECFNIPRDVITVCVGKSTYARCSVVLSVTPFEPEWAGHATLELSNTSPLPVAVYVNEGIGQLLFFRSAAPCAISYADRAGKHQNQAAEVVTVKV